MCQSAPPDLPLNFASLEMILTTFDSWRIATQIPRLEGACRARLRAREHLVPERILLALCLEEAGSNLEAVMAWDEAIDRAESSHDWGMTAGCLLLMARRFPAEAVLILERVSLGVPLRPRPTADLTRRPSAVLTQAGDRCAASV